MLLHPSIQRLLVCLVPRTHICEFGRGRRYIGTGGWRSRYRFTGISRGFWGNLLVTRGGGGGGQVGYGSRAFAVEGLGKG